MKNLLTFAALFSLCFTGIAQDINEIKINSQIEDVTVFLTGGEVHRTAKVNVKPGRNKLIFTRISTVADNKSVQFNADKPYNLVSVSSEIDYLTFIDNNPRIKTINDSMKIIKKQIVDLQNEKSAYESEKQLLQKNNSIKGTRKII